VDFCLELGLEEAMGIRSFPSDGGQRLCFVLMHNILLMRTCLVDLGIVADGAFTHCEGREDVAQFFLHCQRVADFWERLDVRMLSVSTGLPSAGTC
jgi:hypothetical protein